MLLGPRGRATHSGWLGGEEAAGCLSHEGYQTMTHCDGRFEERVKYVTYSDGNILIMVTVT